MRSQSSKNHLTTADLPNNSIIGQYKYQNKDPLFFLRPDSTDMFFMDFKKYRFVKEQLKGTRVPFKFSTQ